MSVSSRKEKQSNLYLDKFIQCKETAVIQAKMMVAWNSLKAVEVERMVDLRDI